MTTLTFNLDCPTEVLLAPVTSRHLTIGARREYCLCHGSATRLMTIGWDSPTAAALVEGETRCFNALGLRYSLCYLH
jgi:hypothetical protein